MSEEQTEFKFQNTTAVELENLHFDFTNPRYGQHDNAFESDEAALEYLLDRFDVTDLLSSISVSGYFEDEPLVAIQDHGRIKVLEGNRRLAACIILGDDPRGDDIDRVQKLREKFRLNDGISLEVLPVIVHQESERENLLPYLGVRHIIGGKAWDSYAKAHWIATIMESNSFPLPKLKRMIGDTKGLTERMVLSYQVVQQLKNNDLFDPNDTIKRGRGSARFPFAVIYNAFDISGFRLWLDMEDGDYLSPNPIPEKSLQKASDLLLFICGRESTGFVPVLKDSRRLRDLLSVVQNNRLYNRLKSGEENLDSILKDTQEPTIRIISDFDSAVLALRDASSVIASESFTSGEAHELTEASDPIVRLVKSIRNALKVLREEDEDEID